MAGRRVQIGGTDGPVVGSHHTSLHTTVAELLSDLAHHDPKISTDTPIRINGMWHYFKGWHFQSPTENWLLPVFSYI